MSDTAVEVVHVWKRFHRGEIHDSLRDLVPALARRLAGRGRRRHELGEGDFWALRDVSFHVQRGEVLGIIGPNGAGKSTLLKVLARILRPNRGKVVVNGRLRALIEIAAGFHQDLTGRENIYLNGTILGMKKREIDARFDEIVEFSGIGPFLETPVKRYSSGMYARLGFAVAAHLEPEILVVDEVLAVGDAEFQQRCVAKMGEVAQGGRTVLFVSHNMGAVQSLCGRTALLREGRLVRMGPTHEVIAAHLGQTGDTGPTPLGDRSDREGSGDIRFTDISIASGDAEDTGVVLCGASVRFVIRFDARREVLRPTFYLGIYDMLGTQLLHMNTRAGGCAVKSVRGPGCCVCQLPRLPLPPGRYAVNVAASEVDRMLDRVQRARTFSVEPGDFYGTGSIVNTYPGKVLVEQKWTVRAEHGPA